MGSFADMALTTKKTIGQAVRHWRKKAGLTQENLARKINPKIRSKNTISRIELGEYNYTIDQLFKIAEIVGCDIKDFFFFSISTKPDKKDLIEKVIEDLKASLDKLTE